MRKKILIIISIILVAAAAFLAVKIWAAFNSDERKSAGEDSSIVFVEKNTPKIELRLAADKDTYYSNDTAHITLEIESSKDANSLMVKIFGITNKFGEDCLAEKKEVSLKKGSKEVLEFFPQLPKCSSCAGYPEGTYEVTAEVYKKDYLLAKDNIKFNLKP
jgi:flagellar basal body-associated protein FliL